MRAYLEVRGHNFRFDNFAQARMYVVNGLNALRDTLPVAEIEEAISTICRWQPPKKAHARRVSVKVGRFRFAIKSFA